MKRPPNDARQYNIVSDLKSAAEFAAEVTRQSGATISVAGPILPVAANLSEGELRKDYPEVPSTKISDGIHKTISFYKTQ